MQYHIKKLVFEKHNYSSFRVNILFPAITTSGDRSLTTGKDQIISCSISGLGKAATIKWIDPDNVDVPTNDPTKYVVDDGTSSFSGGSQTTQLTIKAAQLALLNSAGTYKCSVTSTLYPGSPPSEESVTITPICKCFYAVLKYNTKIIYTKTIGEVFLLVIIILNCYLIFMEC